MHTTVKYQAVNDPTNDPDVTRTRNLLIWSQARYHCATESINSIARCVVCLNQYLLILNKGRWSADLGSVAERSKALV